MPYERHQMHRDPILLVQQYLLSHICVLRPKSLIIPNAFESLRISLQPINKITVYKSFFRSKSNELSSYRSLFVVRLADCKYGWKFLPLDDRGTGGCKQELTGIFKSRKKEMKFWRIIHLICLILPYELFIYCGREMWINSIFSKYAQIAFDLLNKRNRHRRNLRKRHKN